MTEKKKIILALIFLVAFPFYVFCFWMLYQALINQRIFFEMACCNVGFSLFCITLTGFMALCSSPDTPKRLLTFSHTFFILSIVSTLSFFVMVNVVTAILAMAGFFWAFGSLLTNLSALTLFYKKAYYWIFLVTELLWAGFAVFSICFVAEISASC